MDDIEYRYDAAKLRNIIKFLSKKYTVKIGVLAKSKKGTYEGVDALTVAMQHEFGAYSYQINAYIPRRSYLELTKEKKMEVYKSWLTSKKEIIYTKITDGHGEAVLNLIGKKWEAWVKETFMEEGPGWEELHPITIEKRRIKSRRAAGNETAETFPILRDTGALMRSITHEVISD